jgi:DnaJ-class molecular chaperone
MINFMSRDSCEVYEVQINEYGDPVIKCQKCGGTGLLMDDLGDPQECNECSGKGFIIL